MSLTKTQVGLISGTYLQRIILPPCFLAILLSCFVRLSNLKYHHSVVLKGFKPFAIVLCRFKDVAELSIPKSRFYQFLSQSGKIELFDYWREVSYQNIDLIGSEVFGWYTMKYSFVSDGRDPYKDGQFHRNRVAWIAEAIRLCGENGVDVTRFYGLFVIVNAPVDDQNSGLNTVLAISDEWGQAGWRWCLKCQGLVYSLSGSGICPAGTVLDISASGLCDFFQ